MGIMRLNGNVMGMSWEYILCTCCMSLQDLPLQQGVGAKKGYQKAKQSQAIYI